MHDEMNFKKKAIGGIKEMLEGRLTDRLKPKAPPAEHGAAPEGSDAEESLESPDEEKAEDGLPPGAENLTPEERQTLKDLYEKMGC